jgi:hypothetical protein
MNNNPNKMVASAVFEWSGTTLVPVSTDGFLPPVDLSGVGGHQIGEVALIPNAVVGDISAAQYLVEASVSKNPVTWTGGPPPTSGSLRSAVHQFKDASASSPNSQGRSWLLIGGVEQTFANPDAGSNTTLPARVEIQVLLFERNSVGQLLPVR